MRNGLRRCAPVATAFGHKVHVALQAAIGRREERRLIEDYRASVEDVLGRWDSIDTAHAI
jgi:hypothetical protein